MADARRFPRLELPFALVGAAGGFLSVGFLSHPFVRFVDVDARPLTVLVATVVALVAGALARKLCIGRRYAYRLDEPDPLSRASTDGDGVHVVVVLVAGAVIGSVVGTAHDVNGTMPGALHGFASALVFVPVVLAVVRAARASQRARLGTLVAAVDRRAIWSILATALALTTLEATLDWFVAARRVDAALAVAIACICAAVVLGARLADARAHRRAYDELSDLSPMTAFSDEAPKVVDLGLGDDVGARIAQGASAYRDRERTLALVRGDPSEVRRAMDRALRRGRISTWIVGGVLVTHAITALATR